MTAPRRSTYGAQPVADSAADTIAAQSLEPVSVTADGQSVTDRSIADKITADQYKANKTAVRKRRKGIGYTRYTAPGAADDCGGTLSGSGSSFNRNV